MFHRFRKEQNRPSQHPEVSRKQTYGESYVYVSIFLVGLLVLIIHSITWVIPQWKLHQEFVATDCTVLDKQVQTRNEGTTTLYRPSVQISMVFGKETHVLWTFDAENLTDDSGFVPDKKLAEDLIAPFETGKNYPCWYHPGKPQEAVLVRNISFWGWYFLAIPISLIFFGAIGAAWSIRFKTVSDERQAAIVAQRMRFPFALISGISGGASHGIFPTVPDPRMINESPGTELAFRLPVSAQSSIRLIVLAVFTACWNAIAWSVLVWSLYHTQGIPFHLVCSVLFGIVFCGLGLFLLILILHQLLTTFGIGPTILEISDHPIYPGRKYRLVMFQTGTLRFRQLNIELACEEIARFRQGTDTITSRKDVYAQPLYFREDFETTPSTPLRQEFYIRLPIGAMHSMRLEHNEIAWKIVVRAQLIGLPDLYYECPVIVNPVSITERLIE